MTDNNEKIKCRTKKRRDIYKVCEFIIQYADRRTKEELIKILKASSSIDPAQEQFSERTLNRRFDYIRKAFPDKYVQYDFKLKVYRVISK